MSFVAYWEKGEGRRAWAFSQQANLADAEKVFAWGSLLSFEASRAIRRGLFHPLAYSALLFLFERGFGLVGMVVHSSSTS